MKTLPPEEVVEISKAIASSPPLDPQNRGAHGVGNGFFSGMSLALQTRGQLNRPNLTAIAEERARSAPKGAPPSAPVSQTAASAGWLPPPRGPRPSEAYIPKPFVDDYLRSNPRDPWAHYAAGVQSFEAEDPEGAYESYSRALELGGREIDLWVSHASAANATGRAGEALVSAQEALTLSPKDERALAQRMFARSALARRGPSAPEDRAIRTASVLSAPSRGAGPGPAAGANGRVPVRPGYRDSKRILRETETALAERDWERAAVLASEALRADPQNAPAYNRRARAFNRLRRFGEAAADAGSALALEPAGREKVRAHLHRSLAYNHLNRFEEARADARAALRLAEGNSLALGLLAWAEAGRGNRSEALRALSKGGRESRELARLRARALALPEGADLVGVFQDGFALEPGSEARSTEPGRPSRGLPWWWVLAAIAGGIAAGWRFARSVRREPAVWTPPSSGVAEAAPAALAGFETLGPLGRGGMGVVELARDLGTGRLVALKRLREEIRRDPRERERILREARVVAKLSHPGIVSVYEVRETNDEVVVVFEYVEGRSLSEVLSEEGPLSADRAAAWAGAVADAVDHAHARGVVHRDLKPSNVMIDAQGTPRVMDFGIARAAQDAMTRLTGTAAASGTPPYMAPEQEEGRTRRESDVFALGVLLYELVTGELPFPGFGAALHLQKREGRFVPASRRVPGGGPAAFDGIIARALAPDPAARYANAGEFAAALRLAAQKK